MLTEPDASGAQIKQRLESQRAEVLRRKAELAREHDKAAALQAELERLRKEEEAAEATANALLERWKRAKAEADEAAAKKEEAWQAAKMHGEIADRKVDEAVKKAEEQAQRELGEAAAA